MHRSKLALTFFVILALCLGSPDAGHANEFYMSFEDTLMVVDGLRTHYDASSDVEKAKMMEMWKWGKLEEWGKANFGQKKETPASGGESLKDKAEKGKGPGRIGEEAEASGTEEIGKYAVREFPGEKGLEIAPEAAKPPKTYQLDDATSEKYKVTPSFGVSSEISSKYIDRGRTLNKEPVLQSDATISYAGATIGAWSNYSLNNKKKNGQEKGKELQFTETDLFAKYTFNLGDFINDGFLSGQPGKSAPKFLDRVNISGGYNYRFFFDFPGPLVYEENDVEFASWATDAMNTSELSLGMDLDMPLNPYVMAYQDLDQGRGDFSGKAMPYKMSGNGLYYMAGISHTFYLFADHKKRSPAIKEKFKYLDFRGISTTLGLSASFIDGYWTDGVGFGDMVYSWSINIPVLKYFSIIPVVHYSSLLDRDVYRYEENSKFFAGVKIAAKFR
ncbi:MAG: hypothetical protein HQL30_11570 [Candidatus Omnitrophica bacterium]|nr:hypothetical protein [Candidatus Omnitrophota bacterium]